MQKYLYFRTDADEDDDAASTDSATYSFIKINRNAPNCRCCNIALYSLNQQFHI